MENKLSRYVCALWIMSAIFTAGRYISAAILIGAPCDAETFQHTMKAIGPFLPIMSIVCLAGGLLLLIADLVITYRHKKG